MPFYKRIVEPRLVSRLTDGDFGRVGEAGTGEGDEEDGDGLQRRKKMRRRSSSRRNTLEQEPPVPSGDSSSSYSSRRGRSRRPAIRFETLQDVSGFTLASLLRQLADLSRLASGIFQELEAEAGSVCARCIRLHSRFQTLQERTLHLDAKKVAIPVSNLDEESRWTVHYKASWHQQENVFLPSSRSSCVEDLHRQAKVNLKTVLRDCDKLRKDGLRSSQYYSQAPLFSTPAHLSGNCLDEEEDQDQTPTVSSADEENLLHSRRSKTPVPADLSEIDVQTNWTKALPLPTPEERMRQQAQAIQTDVIPINVTGENFDRQAGNRRSLVHSDTPLRRPTKIKRRKTITGLPEAVQKELGAVQPPARGTSSILPGHFSTMSRLESSRSNRARSTTRDSSCQTEEIKVVPPSVRRIRAQKGQGIAAQLSSSSGNMSGTPRAHDELRFHSLPRPCARVSLLDGETCMAGRWKDSCGTLPGRSSSSEARAQAQTSLLPRPKSQELGGPQPAEEGALGASPHAGTGSSAEAVPAGKCWAPGTSVEILAKPRDEHGSSSGNWSGSSGGGGSVQQSPTLDSAPPPSPPDSAICLAVGPRWVAGNQTPAHRLLSDAAEARWNSLYLKEPSSPAGPAEGEGWRGLGERSLSHSISLRKTKKPPPPPARSDSLRRRPKGSAPLLSPSLIASLQRSLEGGLGRQDGPQAPARPSVSVEGPEPWLMRPRSQSSSNSSGRSTGGSNAYSTGAATTPSQSETSSLRSDSGDPWAYYNQEAEGWRQGPWDGAGQPKPKSLSPDKTLGITSPSSGYSSQCNTPTGAGPGLGLPPPCRPSPRPKVKPKVPERRSSLRSSLSASSSSASLSSSASESRPQRAAASAALSPPSATVSHPTASDQNAPPPALYVLPLPAALGHLYLPPAVPLLDSLPTSPPPAPPVQGLLPPAVPLPTSHPHTRLLPKPPSFNLRLPTSPPPAPPVQGLPLPAVPLPTSPAPTHLLPKSPSARLPPSKAPPPAPPLFRLPLPPLLLPGPPMPPSPPPLPSSPLPSAPLPPPPPLDLAALCGGKKLLRPFALSCREEPNARGHQGDALRAAAVGPPLITANALRTVQLRSVRSGGQTQPNRAGIARHKPPVLQRPLSLQSPGKRACNASTPAVKTPPALAADLADSESRAGSVSEPETVAVSSISAATVTSEPLSTPVPLPYSSGATDQGNGANTGVNLEPDPEGALTPKKSKLPGSMPPPIARKPKLSLLIPPSPWEITAREKRPPDVSMSAADTTSSAAERDGTGGGLPSPLNTEECNSGNPRPAERPEGMPQPPAWAAEQNDGDRAVEKSQNNSRTKDEQAKDSSPTWDHLDRSSTTPCQENGTDDVFEECSASLNSSSGDCGEQPSTPSRSRTTEDLFAAIHRSKRRILGRKDSEDEFSRTQSPSSPVTPTGSLASPCSLRQAGSIQRSLRKSSTSSDSFKALLLKKGSRPEQSCRMSAAEMLKSSDPRQRPAEDERAVGRPAGQRGRNPREEWASHEGPMPRGAGVTGLCVRYGRSRTPPSAASSRYSARLHQHRLHSSPMTVIREAEAWEATDDVRRHSDGDISAQGAVPTGDANTQEYRDTLTSPSRSVALCAAIMMPSVASQDWKHITSPSGAVAQGATSLTPGVSNQNWDPLTSPSQGAAILTAGDAKQDWDS
ncbi:NHS-like protein 1 [Rhinoraja longicauda]